jgi:hypothetical protein
MPWRGVLFWLAIGMVVLILDNEWLTVSTVAVFLLYFVLRD